MVNKFVLSVLVAFVMIGVISFASALSSGPRDAGTGSDLAGVGTVTWTNPGGIVSSGSPYAMAVLPASTSSHYLKGINYGFGIPDNTIINGISVTINHQSSSGAGRAVRDTVVQLVKSGSIVGTNKAVAVNWPTSMGTATYGNSTDMWGTTWTADDINNANFGVVLAVDDNNKEKNATVDYMQVTVYYTIADATGPTTSLTSPLENAILKGDVTITADASDPSGVDRVEFWMASIGTKIGEDTSAPYSIDWDTTTADDGHHSLWINAYDTFGNLGTSTPVNVIVNNLPPTIIGMSSNMTVKATSADGAVVSWTDPTATDLVDGTVPVVCAPSSGSTFALGNTTVTCTSSDNAGNTATDLFNVEVVDTTAPDLSLPADITAEATGPAGAIVGFAPTASDIVDGAVAVLCDYSSGDTFALGTTTVTCNATDAAGNTASGLFNVEVVDTTPPAITAPLDINGFEATGLLTAVDIGTPTVTDLVDPAPIVTNNAPIQFPIGTTTVTWTATDASGNNATATQSVTVQDKTPPAITVPADITAEATSGVGAIVAYSGESASDIVDGSIVVSCNPVSGSTFGLGNTTVTCSATDNAENTGTSTFNVEVVDTTKPVLTLPSDLSLEADSPAGKIVDYSASALDAVDGSVAVTCGPASGSQFALGNNLVTCSATDNAGNTATGTFNINVVDTTAPDLSLPADITAEATGPAGAIVGFAPTASDIVDGAVAVLCDYSSGDTFALGTTTVTCNATDAAGNTAANSFHVIVKDTTKPAIILVGANPQVIHVGDSYTELGATASDIVDGDLTGSIAADSSAVNTSLVGSYTVTYNVADKSGNNADTLTRTVDVVDTEIPIISLSGNNVVNVEVHSTYTDAGATAEDNYDGDLTGSIQTVNPVNIDKLGSYTITYDVADSNGNHAEQVTRTVNVIDTTAPVITVPSLDAFEATSADGAAVDYSVSASDNYDDGVDVNCNYKSGHVFPIGTTNVTCSATDSSENIGYNSFLIVVQDTIPPQLNLPDSITAEATSASGAVVTYNVSATDTADNNVNILCTPSYGSTFALGTTSVSCTAKDNSDNSVSGTFNINVVDTTKPIITLIGDSEVNITVGDSYTDAGATASDIVDGNLTGSIVVGGSVDTSTVGAYTLTYDVADSNGNKAMQIARTVNVVDAVITPASVGAGGAGIGNGIGNGGCVTQWDCSNWSVCANGIQTRTCSYPAGYCAPLNAKPAESQTCTASANANTPATQPTTQTTTNGNAGRGITGAVIGALGSGVGMVIVLFLVVIAGATIFLRLRKSS